MEPDSVGIAHPEWRMLNSAGKPNGYCCGNTGCRDLVRNRIVELVKDVGVDGIFFDMYHAVGNACYCSACEAKFHAQTGQDPPVKEDFDSLVWQQWVEFKYRSIEEALGDFNHRIYFTVTSDFERLEPVRLLHEPGFNVIDATIVQDGKRFLMFLKDETRHPPAKNLRLATADASTGPYSQPSAPMTGKYWAEGPTAIKLGDCRCSRTATADACVTGGKAAKYRHDTS